jgi:pilus assembly protein Flp/PilA
MQDLLGKVRHGHGKSGCESGCLTSSDSHMWTLMELPMKNLFVRFVKDNSGATAIEYGLIAAGISVAIIAVVNGLGSTLNTKFSSISTQLK